MKMILISEINIKKKKVLIRCDMNVPMKDGKIISYTRIIKSLKTIKYAINKKAIVIIASHLGRPKEGIYDDQFSMKPIVNFLKKHISLPIRLVKNYVNGFNPLPNYLTVLENVRFNKGEKENNIKLSQKYSKLCDIFVMDAFASAHRLESSTVGVGNFSKISCAGFLFNNEIKNLSKIIKNPLRPMISIIGGSKISTKLNILESLSKISDKIIVGGGVANTFLASKGLNIGKSIYEYDLIDSAKNILLKNKNILLPVDVKVSNNLNTLSNVLNKSIYDIKNDEKILDIGNISINNILNNLKKSKTILWNGPLGLFENSNFQQGTKSIANYISENNVFSVVGGGDTIAAIELCGIYDKVSYISTGGGSFLNFIEGKKLPVISMLEKYSK
ncbi:MAG: phosphoglycerate kinase [Candidatus Makana argininalis]